MKPNTQTIYKWITLLVVFPLSIIVLLSFTSCSDAKQAQKGYNKFIKHGGKIEYKRDTVTVADTIKGIDGKDSIVYRNVECICPEIEMPKTRWQTRIEYRYKTKVEKAQIKWQTKYKIKYVKQVQKQDSKAFKWYHYLLLVVAFILGAYLRGVIASLFYVIKK
jgi:hypothetical protein